MGDWRDKLPPTLLGKTDDWEVATGRKQGEATWNGGLGRTCEMTMAAQGPRPELACDVPWCLASATVAWHRTPAELAAMKKGAKCTVAQEVRQLCAEHAPRWRADVYAPMGQARPKAAVEQPAARKRAVVATTNAPALAAVLDELAAVRAELADAQRQLKAHKATWQAHREALENLRLARAELASLRAATDPAAMLAELVSAPARLPGDPFTGMAA